LFRQKYLDGWIRLFLSVCIILYNIKNQSKILDSFLVSISTTVLVYYPKKTKIREIPETNILQCQNIPYKIFESIYWFQLLKIVVVQILLKISQSTDRDWILNNSQFFILNIYNNRYSINISIIQFFLRELYTVFTKYRTKKYNRNSVESDQIWKTINNIIASISFSIQNRKRSGTNI